MKSAYPSKTRGWNQHFEKLAAFKEQNPKRWPDENAPDAQEKKLAKWCDTIRKLYLANHLEKAWIEKLATLKFNFTGKEVSWNSQFKAFEKWVKQHGQAPESGNPLYHWCRNNLLLYPSLTAAQKSKLESVDFLRYFQEVSWEARFELLKNFIRDNNGQMPTNRTDRSLAQWVQVQRKRYAKGKLKADKVALFRQAGIALSHQRNEAQWDENLAKLKKFLAKSNGRWPSGSGSEPEQKLYRWCLVQRKAYKLGRHRHNPMWSRRAQALEAIGFAW